ncbi:MAG: 1-acyl-sn-glycerol-3-phosphate acyltransferase [Treponema sp.]|jgi:glycerol-3-phosphate O-acyltransferase|nr:1-acyl-sn-glycerol-3-phosphate acyltransferase [Treponema sp.]
MDTLSSAFRDIIRKAVRITKTATLVTEQNVYQQGDANIIPLLDQIVETLILPGSGISGMENLLDLYGKAVLGKSCVLLLEHYSNLDLSLFSCLLRKESEKGGEIADAVVAIAGIKLNEENPVVAAFTGAYSRIVIYPSRSLQGLDTEKDRAEIVRSNGINRAAMKALLNIKVSGKLILVFPSGTRYRPWNPDTKKGVREIDSYLKSFDYMCPVAINGEVLHVCRGDMMEDFVSKDLVRITAGPVLSCAEFRNRARAEAEARGIEDKKQAAVDAIMRLLEDMHNKAEPERQALLKQVPGPA